MSVMKHIVALVATGVITVPSMSAEMSAVGSTALLPTADTDAASFLPTMTTSAESTDSKSEPEIIRRKPEGRVHARIDWLMKSPAKMERTEHPQK